MGREEKDTKKMDWVWEEGRENMGGECKRSGRGNGRGKRIGKVNERANMVVWTTTQYYVCMCVCTSIYIQ